MSLGLFIAGWLVATNRFGGLHNSIVHKPLKINSIQSWFAVVCAGDQGLRERERERERAYAVESYTPVQSNLGYLGPNFFSRLLDK